MTEEELFEIMKREFPQDGKVAFMLGVDHWHNNYSDGEYYNYRLSMIPGRNENCDIVYSKIGWNDLYAQYLVWRDQDA